MMAEPALSEDHLDLVLEKMYQQKGWDFRRYRKSSLKRCIERRISFSRLPSREYIERLDSEPAEFHHLFNHITIKVSEFFRDLDVFNQIERHVIPATLGRLKSEGRNTLRIWSCGCAKGEEPYSLAMLLCRTETICPYRALDFSPGYFRLKPDTQRPDTRLPDTQRPDTRLPDTQRPDARLPDTQRPDARLPDTQRSDTRHPNTQRGFRTWPDKALSKTSPDAAKELNIKIFATDIDESFIEMARKGIFSPDSFTNLSHALRDQFFKPVDSGFQVIPQVRNLLTFGVHNIVSCIHLSHMDILLCRNLLIYFEKDLQEKVFEKFFYSLNKGGFIILGKSEVVPSLFRDRFREVFKKEKIYQKV